ncbi:MAG: glycosyltransferase family 2 protein [Candidatus Bathyarchaeia archaeon]
MKITASVVCVTFNSVHHVRRLASSLQKQTFRNFEVIIVDNSRNSLIQQYVESLQREGDDRFMYLPNKNDGYPGGNVKGVNHARGDFVFILNPDTRLEEDTIEILVSQFRHLKKDVMVLVPKIMIRDSKVINSVGMKRVREMEDIYMNIGFLEEDIGQYDTPQLIRAFDGSAFMFRRELLSHTFLFDPHFFFGEETTDLAERMSMLGFSAYTCPNALVHHELRGTVTSPKQNDRMASIIVRNSLIRTMRNTQTTMFWRTLLIGICFRNIIGRLITRNNSRAAIIYMRGLAMFILQVGIFIRNKPTFGQQTEIRLK